MELNPCIDEIHCYKGKSGLYNLEIIGTSEKNEPIQINVEDVDMSKVQVTAYAQSIISRSCTPPITTNTNINLLGNIVVKGLVIEI